jgi:DNA polymerase zeta
LKGIEVVRRDNCPAVGKLQEKALRLLFSTKDASVVKSWLVGEWEKILSLRVSPIDFIFAKEVRTNMAV